MPGRWVAPIITGLVVAFALVGSQLQVLTGNQRLQLETRAPVLYQIFSPFSRTLDGLTLLSVPQTIAVWVTIALMWFLIRMPKKGWKSWTVRLVSLLAVVAIVEAAVAYLPRPMLALASADPDDVIVDFHSHTGYSHDVRKSFTLTDALRWHEAGGFDITWITDHVKFSAKPEITMSNPQRAGDGTSLLLGVEGRYHKIMSTIMLGLDQRDSILLNKRGNLLPGTPVSGVGPVTIVATPNRNLDSVTTQSLDSLEHFVALELLDAAPRGLGQFDKEEPRLRELAALRDFTLVAASNNHGFGRAVAAWNIVHVRGWKNMSPYAVGDSILGILRNHRSRDVTIVARTRPHTYGLSLPLTLPVLFYSITAGIGWREAISWIIWIAIITALVEAVPLMRKSSELDAAPTRRRPRLG
jgi:hypothetical protein